MVKHMIIWKFKDEILDQASQALAIKTALEGLVGKIEGLLEMRIITEKLPSSAGDIMMDSSFVNETALQNYQKHPLHVEIANNLVRPCMQTRLSLDYTL